MRDIDRVIEVCAVNGSRYAATPELREKRKSDSIFNRHGTRTAEDGRTYKTGHFELCEPFVGLFYVADCMDPPRFLVSGESFEDAHEHFVDEYVHLIEIDLTNGPEMYDYIQGEAGNRGNWESAVDPAYLAVLAELDGLSHLARLKRLCDEPEVVGAVRELMHASSGVSFSSKGVPVDTESVQCLVVAEITLATRRSAWRVS